MSKVPCINPPPDPSGKSINDMILTETAGTATTGHVNSIVVGI